MVWTPTFFEAHIRAYRGKENYVAAVLYEWSVR